MQRDIKQSILHALSGGETRSGEELAGALGVTRAAVWKAIAALRKDGYPITAVTNRGYTLQPGGCLSEQVISAYGSGGFAVRVYQEVDSTNNVAKMLAAQGVRETAVLADTQTGGKGRMGRSFSSPSGSGLYLSLILSPGIRFEDSALLTTYAAVAVAESIEALTGAVAGIKWVNDVRLGGKKVCGILTEGSVDMESGGFSYAVVGIGVNLHDMQFPPELAQIATDLESETGVSVDRNRFAAELLQRMANLPQELASGAFLERYRSRLEVLGKELLVTRGSERFTARAIGLSDRAELIVETENGTLLLQSGEVSTKETERS